MRLPSAPATFLVLLFSLVSTACVATTPATAPAPVTMTMDGKPLAVGDYAPSDIPAMVLDNGLLKITFGKDAIQDFSATSIIVKGTELAHNLNGIMPRDQNAQRTFYHDYSGSNGILHARIIRVFENQPYRVHFAIIDNGSPYLEDHFVMLPGESGIHPYVIIRSNFSGEMRTMYRFDMHILDHTWTPERMDMQISYAFLQSIHDPGNVADETWRLPANNPAGLPEGSVYSKYDWCLYYSEAPMWGHLGHGFGAWFIPVSTEAYAGGPLRQDLSVHQDALILNYLGGGHLGSGGSASGRDGAKIFGPWYVYFNTGDSLDAIVADAKQTAYAEQKKWPYQWMNEPLFPTQRTTVTGQLTITHDRSAANAYIILAQPTTGGGGRGGAGAGNSTGAVPDRAAGLANQSGDYMFYVKADANGKFTLPAVRPGTYTLYAWQTQGPITQSFAQDGITISGDTQDLGKLVWDAPYHPDFLWQIGQSDRLAGEFKLGNGPRAAMLLYQVPADLTYTIGKSTPANDWYFAQRTGTWMVAFNLDKTYTGNAYLTIAMAGGQGNVALALNGESIGSLSHPDDGSLRRSANRSGVYNRSEITFPASLLKKGDNTLTLRATTSDSSVGTDGGPGLPNGLMYDTLVMEAD
ncbi:MAG TPA: polysaccharide lyase family protein [Opitutales bacterium]|jgi:rhamnogalacturonan endolyase|nr:polysaccharide lyase family protein [Opitutales bacterium]